MSYVDRILQPNETVTYRGALHWVIYLSGLAFSLAALAAAVAGLYLRTQSGRYGLSAVAAILIVVGLAQLASAWLKSMSTEIIVTNRRVIYKTGLISRNTIEMNLDKIESVLVQQDILGRILDYGTLIVRGVGSGMEPVSNVAAPLKLHQYLNAPV